MVAAPVLDTQREPISCHGCGQMLGWRLQRSGALLLIGPHVSDEPDGVRLTCPKCGKRCRVRNGNGDTNEHPC